MNVILLESQNISLSKKKILEHKADGSVFVVDGKCKLHEYISKLELRESIQSRMLICKELDINVLLKRNGQEDKFILLSDLLKALEPDKEVCEVVVLGDVDVSEKRAMEVRYQLCDIIQQFIYINIQLAKVHVCTEKESRDNEKIRAFENKISKYESAVMLSLNHINEINDNFKNYKSDIQKHLENIKKYIDETQDNELKIAVAATKKAGKSVIVNSMIEVEIAPTSLELPTPNNCIYRRSTDNTYCLSYKGKNYSAVNHEDIHTKLREIFKEARKDYENGLGIPDMELWYPATQTGFSSYTIYDTPGPNLAGATKHKNAAKKGVEAADVIVFTINYSVHLTDDEYNYICDIWHMCQDKGKNYSLIINVNQLDRRFESEDDKSAVRIVDFIRDSLIDYGKQKGIDFHNCIVIGTSALTYFNSISATKYKCPNGDCSALSSKFSSSDEFEAKIKKCNKMFEDCETIPKEYVDRATSALAQLKNTISNADMQCSIELLSLEEVKVFSGMPNLLEYVKYISTQKARNEKVNNLMFKIDSEYRAIMNLFHIEELMHRLQDNKEALANALATLENFQKAVENILDDDYNDLYNENYISICNSNENMQSVYLLELTKKRPIKIEDVKKIFFNEVDKQLGLEAFMDEVTGHEIETNLTRKLKNEYNKDLKIDVICKDYVTMLMDVCTETTSKFVSERKVELGQNLECEQKAICKTFKYIWETRLKRIKETVNEYSDRLTAECAERLKIEVPDFQIVFGKNSKCTGYTEKFDENDKRQIEKYIQEGLRSLTIWSKRKAVIEQRKQGQKSDDFFANLAEGVLDIKAFFKRKTIELNDILNFYHEKKLRYELESAYKKSGNLASYLSDVRKSFESDMNDFVGKLEEDIEDLSKNINETTKAIKSSIDDSKKYQKTVEELENEKLFLSKLKEAVSNFTDMWKEVINL